MNNKNKKVFKLIKLFTENPIIFIMLVLVMIISLTFAQISNSYEKNQVQEEMISNLERDIEAERQKQLRLYEEREYMNSKEYIEKVARERLGLIKEDEILFLMEDRN